jgi:hypothetical protein
MTIKLFNKIKEVIDEIINESPFNKKLLIKDKELIYYNCYLVSYEIKNGFYPEIFREVDEKKLKKIRKITNLDFIKCACYDNSIGKDTIYIYNKNKYKSVKKSIDYLNKTKITNTNVLKVQSNIANLLSYDKIKRDYNEAFDGNKTLLLKFIIINYKYDTRVTILAYQSYKSKLIKNYEKLQKINNLPIFHSRVSSIGRCLLEIEDIGL